MIRDLDLSIDSIVDRFETPHPYPIESEFDGNEEHSSYEG